MSMPLKELLAKVKAGGDASEWGRNFQKLERRLLAFANADGLYEVMSITEEDWGFIEDALTAANEHTAWVALNKLRNALQILDGVKPGKGNK